MTTIHSAAAPAALGPYSQAVRYGNLVFSSGQIGLDPVTMQLVDGAENQTRRVFANLAAILEAADAHLRDVLRLTLYVDDLANWAIVNAVMSDCFAPPYPARTTVEVKSLPLGALIEIDAIAMARQHDGYERIMGATLQSGGIA